MWRGPDLAGGRPGPSLIVGHFGIHENAFDITRNALIPQLPGDFAPSPSAGTLPPAHPLGTHPRYCCSV